MSECANVKTGIRETALRLRQALSVECRDAAAKALASHWSTLTIDRHPVIVAGYMPIRGEIDPHPLMRALASRGACLALPTIAADAQPLIFRVWCEGDPLRRGALGIREPLPDADVAVPDIVLVPLAAFDRRGHRIGYGAGHYDRALATLQLEKSILTVGLAFAVQEVPRVPNEAHDVPLDLVLTEREIISAGSHEA